MRARLSAAAAVVTATALIAASATVCRAVEPGTSRRSATVELAQAKTQPGTPGQTNLNLIVPVVPPRPQGFDGWPFERKAARLLEDRDEVGFIELALQTASGPDANRVITWSANSILSGGPPIVADIAGRIYNGAANARTNAAERDEGRRRAAIYTLYALALTMVDGAACADASAREQRMIQRRGYAAPSIDWMAQRSPAERAEIIDRVIAIESDTYSKRKVDLLICWAGREGLRNADFGSARVAGDRMEANIRVTTTYVPTKAGWTPALRSDAEAARQTVRARLRQTLESAFAQDGAKSR